MNVVATTRSTVGEGWKASSPIIRSGPTPSIHGIVRWQEVVDLCQGLFEEIPISVSETTMSRELRAMGYRRLSARPRHHAQREGAEYGTLPDLSAHGFPSAEAGLPFATWHGKRYFLSVHLANTEGLPQHGLNGARTRQ